MNKLVNWLGRIFIGFLIVITLLAAIKVRADCLASQALVEQTANNRIQVEAMIKISAVLDAMYTQKRLNEK